MWQQWINAILGVWIIITPFIGLSEQALTTNLVIVGIVILILGWWGAMEKKKA